MHDIARYNWGLRWTRYVFGNTKIAFPLYCFPSFWIHLKDAASFISQKSCCFWFLKYSIYTWQSRAAFQFCCELRSNLTSPTQPRCNHGRYKVGPRANHSWSEVEPSKIRVRPAVRQHYIYMYSICIVYTHYIPYSSLSYYICDTI